MRERTMLSMAAVAGLAAGAVAYKAILRKPIYCPWSEPGTVVVVASVPLEAGSAIDYPMLSQRYLPERLVTPLAVKPDEASCLVGLRLLWPMEAHESLTWGHLGTECTQD